MDITKYTGYFHDGSILNIKHSNNIIIFSLESGYVNPKELDEKLSLSNVNTLIGNLIIKNPQSITINDHPTQEPLQMNYEDGLILDLYIFPKEVKILVEWSNFQPKPRKREFSKIVITSEKIYWENLPRLDTQ